MKINNIQNTCPTNFTSRKIFETTLCRKTAEGIKIPVRSFISELTKDDFGRADLCPKRWTKTLFGKDILKDFKDWYFPHLRDKYSYILPYGGEYRFFTVETPHINGNKSISLGEVRILDDFVILDRLQALIKGRKAQKHIFGAGSGILYAVVELADKLKKPFVKLEAKKDAVGFYKKAGMQLEKKCGKYNFYVYQPNYKTFLENLRKKLGITQAQ